MTPFTYERAADAPSAVARVREQPGATFLGGVAHKPWRAQRAEQVLRGGGATLDNFRRAADAELADAKPQPGNAFKIPLARNTLIGVLRELTGVTS